MNNSEKIRLINQIVQPYFNFEMDDIYGDKGGIPYPKIEELNTLFFKKNGKDRKLFINKMEEQIILNKLKELNIGSVEIIKIQSLGVFIIIELFG
jgi:hypothetical protein